MELALRRIREPITKNTNMNYVLAKTHPTNSQRCNNCRWEHAKRRSCPSKGDGKHEARRQLASRRPCAGACAGELQGVLEPEWLEPKLSKRSWFHIETTVVWLIYGEIWDDPTKRKTTSWTIRSLLSRLVHVMTKVTIISKCKAYGITSAWRWKLTHSSKN